MVPSGAAHCVGVVAEPLVKYPADAFPLPDAELRPEAPHQTPLGHGKQLDALDAP